ncbi:hypothetical protein ACFPC0_10785 [Streptomyces andamanensis]|uniref:Uncharacterized protein n=1 Tax=Streptomyces andamanensis TaxID=1565035 RepID=A0ABV8TCG5_9ACTN
MDENTATQVPVHPGMEKIMRRTLEETGIPCQVEICRPGHWRVSHGSERVRTVIDLRRSGHSHKLTMNTTLYVDGKQRPPVRGEEAYGRLLRHPDNPHPERPPVRLPKVEELPREHMSLEKLRGPAQRISDSFTTDGRSAPPVRCGTATTPKHGKVLVLEADAGPGKGVLHMYFRLDGRLVDIAAVDHYGGDVMTDFKDPRELFKQWFGIRLPTPPPMNGARQGRTDTAGAVSNAVSVRRATVFRI